MQKVLLTHETELASSLLPLGMGNPTLPQVEPFHICTAGGAAGTSSFGSVPTSMQKVLLAHESDGTLSAERVMTWPDPLMSDQSEGLVEVVTAEAGAPLRALAERQSMKAATQGTSLRTASSFCSGRRFSTASGAR